MVNTPSNSSPGVPTKDAKTDPELGTIDVHDLYELQVLEHVEQTPRLSNRMVRDKLGVSIRLAHEILTRMVKKGLMHVKKRHARRWDYFLTPKGISQKTRLTMEFLKFSMHFYQEARKRSAQVCKDISLEGKTKIAYLGATELAEICHLGVQEWGLEVVAVYDDEPPKPTFLTLEVEPVSALNTTPAEAIIVCLYDPKMPMRKRNLPNGVEAKDDLWFIF